MFDAAIEDEATSLILDANRPRLPLATLLKPVLVLRLAARVCLGDQSLLE